MIFRLFHLKFFRMMVGWLNCSSFSMLGFSIDILCEVWACLSFVPAYPIACGFLLRKFAIVFIVVKWSMSLFSSSHHKKPLASGLEPRAESRELMSG